jgi:hypothetical protein
VEFVALLAADLLDTVSAFADLVFAADYGDITRAFVFFTFQCLTLSERAAGIVVPYRPGLVIQTRRLSLRGCIPRAVAGDVQTAQLDAGGVR